MMKTFLVAGLLSLSMTVRAEPTVKPELEKLRSDCEKAVNVAARPIYQRYQSTLDQMLRRATQANDAESAGLISAEIERVSLLSQTRESLAALFAGSRWGWFDTSTPGEKTENWMEFYKDGTGVTSWGSAVRFEVTAPATLRIIEEAPPITWTFVVNVAKKVVVADKSAGGEQRSMRYERNGPILNPAKK